MTDARVCWRATSRETTGPATPATRAVDAVMKAIVAVSIEVGSAVDLLPDHPQSQRFGISHNHLVAGVDAIEILHLVVDRELDLLAVRAGQQHGTILIVRGVD